MNTLYMYLYNKHLFHFSIQAPAIISMQIQITYPYLANMAHFCKARIKQCSLLGNSSSSIQILYVQLYLFIWDCFKGHWVKVLLSELIWLLSPESIRQISAFRQRQQPSVQRIFAWRKYFPFVFHFPVLQSLQSSH